MKHFWLVRRSGRAIWHLSAVGEPGHRVVGGNCFCSVIVGNARSFLRGMQAVHVVFLLVFFCWFHAVLKWV